MTTTKKDDTPDSLADAVDAINLELAAIASEGPEDAVLLTRLWSGFSEEVTFAGATLWHSDEESRAYDEGTDEWESWATFLQRRVRDRARELHKICEHCAQIGTIVPDELESDEFSAEALGIGSSVDAPDRFIQMVENLTRERDEARSKVNELTDALAEGRWEVEDYGPTEFTDDTQIRDWFHRYRTRTVGPYVPDRIVAGHLVDAYDRRVAETKSLRAMAQLIYNEAHRRMESLVGGDSVKDDAGRFSHASFCSIAGLAQGIIQAPPPAAQTETPGVVDAEAETTRRPGEAGS